MARLEPFVRTGRRDSPTEVGQTRAGTRRKIFRSKTMSLFNRSGWAGRLLIGAVTFWWGGVVAPRLISLAAPARLPPEAIPAWTDPHWDGQLADLVLAASLLSAALLSLAACLRPGTPRAGLFARGGWATLAATVLYLSWAEISDLHLLGLGRLQLEVLGARLFESSQARASVAGFYPLILVFVLGMSLFLWKGVRDRSIRFLLAVGLLAWFFAVVLDETYYGLSQGAATDLVWLCEETLEFSGALLVGWAAVVALRQRVRLADRGAADCWRKPLLLSALVVTLLGSLALALLFRPPLADSRSPPNSRAGAFDMVLSDDGSVLQELGVLPAPLGGVDLRMSSNDPSGRGHAIWRVARVGTEGPGRFVVQGRTELPGGTIPREISLTFPPIADATVRSLAIQVVADVALGSDLRIGATNSDRYREGMLWINGEAVWPDQNLEFVAYGAPELSLDKLRALGHLFALGWRWPSLLALLWASLILVCFVPSLLTTEALRQTGAIRG